MNTNQEIIIIILMAFGFCGGVAFGHRLDLAGVKDNTIENYHCAAIVKVKTLEEAKAITEAHQKRIGSIK